MTTTQIEPAATLAELRESKPDRVTIVLLSGELDKAMAAFIIATGAAAMGMQVTMFFTFSPPFARLSLDYAAVLRRAVSHQDERSFLHSSCARRNPRGDSGLCPGSMCRG